ncbi:PREDICTED: uncharacterized protein LOC104586088 isoform X2 [Nelumbo nucifera]|uniref:Uncharacterized protein LOC104586088 isoform X2 n=1 Tax=Nelumbo nucifera TaxID=4432 RepID=A0A1U7YRA5_NELNU|nr:PREDICTED: uncharacterized protein LOC104586088 isoform X2 [Nelumbo nucifera]
MKAASLIALSSSVSTPRCLHGRQCRHLKYTDIRTIGISCSLRRRKPKTKTKPASNEKIEMVIDIEEIANQASTSLRRIIRSSEVRLHRFVSSGKEAIRDLQALVMIDSDRRIVISCRRSSLLFLANFVLWSCVIVFSVRVLVDLGFRFGSRLGFGYGSLIWRRDRSLGGREVVVGGRFRGSEERKKNLSVSVNPLSPARVMVTKVEEMQPQKRVTVREKKLPSWWPVSLPSPTLMVNKEELQREANRIIRAIMDNKMSGRDFMEEDVMHLRQICKTSGARVSMETANARSSFYRTSVELVLNTCISSMSYKPVQMGGEDARQFVAGLADNIGLEDIDAVRIVSATVAARTRSRFLQAWAFEMQGSHSEAMVELSGICLIHQIFPPEESSPEMDMVARGLKKQLREDQRKFLLNLLVGVCGAKSRRSAAEALGLDVY